jgi:hypothetical protein
MKNEEIKLLAENHAKNVLGEYQFTKNKDAAQSIMTDYLKGFEDAKEMFGGNSGLPNLKDKIESLLQDTRYFESSTELLCVLERDNGMKFQIQLSILKDEDEFSGDLITQTNDTIILKIEGSKILNP